MKTSLLPTILAALSLGVSGILVLKVFDLERDVKSIRAPVRSPERSYTAAEASDWGTEDLTPGAPPAAEAGPRATPRASAPPSGPARERTLEEKVADVERQLQAMKAERAPTWTHPQRFASSVDDLSRQLSLTPTQRTRIQDAIDRGKQRIEDVLKIPDETGKSPFERREEARKRLEESMNNPQPGPVLAFMSDAFAYRGRKIPGRNDTYGDEIDRIKKETRDEVASALDAKQREAFEDTSLDPLLGGGGQISIVSSIATGPDEEPGAGIIVEMGATMTEEDPVPTQTEPQPSGAGSGG